MAETHNHRRGRGSGVPRKPRITKADRERLELEKQERERLANKRAIDEPYGVGASASSKAHEQSSQNPPARSRAKEHAEQNAPEVGSESQSKETRTDIPNASEPSTLANQNSLPTSYSRDGTSPSTKRSREPESEAAMKKAKTTHVSSQDKLVAEENTKDISTQPPSTANSENAMSQSFTQAKTASAPTNVNSQSANQIGTVDTVTESQQPAGPASSATPSQMPGPIHSTAETGMPPPIENRPSWGDPKVEDGSVSWRVGVTEDEGIRSHSQENLGGRMDLLVGEMNSLCNSVFMSSTAAIDQKEQLVLEPSSGLERIYRLIFDGEGPAGSWRSEAFNYEQENLLAIEIMRAVIGAGVHLMVFDKSVSEIVHDSGLPASVWRSTRETMDLLDVSLGSLPFYIDKAYNYRNRGEPVDSLEYKVWQGAQMQMRNPFFHQNVLRPIARTLADRLLMTVNQQLAQLNIAKPREGTKEAFWNDRRAQLTEVFTRALLIKGIMESSLHKYEFEWVSSGQKYDPLIMQTDRPPRDPNVNIAYAMTPIVCRNEPDGTQFLTARAMGCVCRWS